MLNEQDMIEMIKRGPDQNSSMPIVMHQYSGGAKTFVRNGKEWMVHSNVQILNDVTGEPIAPSLTYSSKPTYVKGSGKTGRVKGEKQTKAAVLFEANKTMAQSDLVALFMKELDMTKAGATTYAYNQRKAAGLVTGKKGKKAKAAA